MITSLYGKCDGVKIVFSFVGGNVWKCDVPTDFKDGTYVIELWATNEHGGTAYYTGTFYIFDSRFIGLEIDDDLFQTVFFDCFIVKGGDRVQYFYLGEKKYISLVVENKKNQPFVITDATYKIYDSTERVVSEGNCVIGDNVVQVLYEPAEKGLFYLVVTYTIAPEIRKVRCEISVN